MTTREQAGPDRASLMKDVEAYEVVYDTALAKRVVDGELRAIGFDVTLSATHRADVRRAPIGGTHAHEIYEALKAIAEAVIPPDNAINCFIRPFDHAIHESVQRRMREDVELVIELRHASGYLDAVDEAERHGVEEIKRALDELGVQYRVWRS